MSYNFDEVFTYFTKDEHWIKKIFVVASYYLIAVLLFLIPLIGAVVIAKISASFEIFLLLPLFWLFSAIFFWAPNGFCLQAGNERLKGKTDKLPELKDFFKQAYIGFKYALGCTLLYLPVVAFYVFLAINYPEYFDSSSSEAYSLKEFTADACGNILYTVFSLFIPAGLSLFLENLNPFAFLNFKRMFINIKNNFVSYLIFIGIVFATGMSLGISYIFIIFIIGIVLVPVLDVLITLVCTELGVQYAKMNTEANTVQKIETQDTETQENQ